MARPTKKEKAKSKKVDKDKIKDKKKKVDLKATASSKKSKKDTLKDSFFDPYEDINSTLDSIEKDLGIAGSGLNLSDQRLSSGMLATDLVMGKGLLPGWYTVFGPEQSCKSTSAMTILSSALESEVPIIAYWDPEGSGDPQFIENQFKTYGIKLSIEDIFGVEDPKSGKYIKQPKVRYSKSSVAERFFDYVFKLTKRIPDKVKIGDSWYYIFDDTKENRKKVGDKYDMNYWRKTKRLRVPAKDGNIQALVIVDSYPALLSEKQDDEDAGGSGMAANARMFSAQLNRVVGRLSSKRICVVGVNQLRQRPGVSYGDPSYEPCGEALKFYSSVRIRHNARALSGAPFNAKGKGMVEEEHSVTRKGKDQYRYISIRGTKNKLGMPYQEGWLRLWIEDANGEARGFDPVFDTFFYLDKTDQIEHKSRKNIRFTIKGKETKKPIDWYEFKTLIVGKKEDKSEIFKKIGLKPFNLREFCKKQLATGNGMELYIEAKKKDKPEEEDDD